MRGQALALAAEIEDKTENAMRFGLLGSIELRLHDCTVPLGPLKQHMLLAALLFDGGRPVTFDTLVDRVWDESPPADARAVLYTYTSRLRRLFAGLPAPYRTVVTVQRWSGGYQLQSAPDLVDLNQFRALLEAGRSTTDLVRRADLLRDACGLWRGEALAGLPGEWAARAREGLGQQRSEALVEWADAAVEVGRSAVVVEPLRAAIMAAPTAEPLAERLMRALYLDGRAAEALDCFAQTRSRLDDLLGVQPGDRLRALHQTVLREEPLITAVSTTVREPTTAEAAAPACQLPPDLPDFTGHDGEFEAARATLVGAGPRLVVVCGQGGVGKTAMTLRLAYALQDVYPDGQLFLNLGGGRGEPLEPAAALSRALRGLGVLDAERIRDIDERIGRLRTELSRRRVLVVLDDVASALQVQPFLTGSGRSAVVASSRSRLTTLAGAHQIELGVLSPPEAMMLLGRVAGPTRVAAEPEASARLVQLCACLPLAIRVAGARLAAKPHWSVRRLADRLGDERRRLDELALDDLEVRASLAVGYRGLEPRARWTFHCLGHLDPPDFTTATVAALLGVEGLDDAEDLVEQMADAHLVEVAFGAGSRTRYRMHDLVRIYARERAQADDRPDALRSAVRRALQAYLALAEAAAQQLPVTTPRLYRLPVCGHAGPPGQVEAEEPALIAGVERAAVLGLDQEACSLADALVQASFALRNNFDAWERTHSAGIAAARTAGNRLAEAALECGVGELRYTEDRFEAARVHFARAEELFRAAGDARGAAIALNGLGTVGRELGEHHSAIPQLEAACRELAASEDPAGMAHAHYGLGYAHRELGQDGRAHHHLRAALRLYRRTGHRRGEVIAVRGIGLVHRACGELEAAEDLFAQAHRMAEGIGDVQISAYTTQALAKTWLRRGDPDRALRSLGPALATLSQMRDGMGVALITRTIGEAFLAAGRTDEAIIELGRAMSGWQRIGHDLGRARALRDLGAARHCAGDREAGHADWELCLRLFGRLGTREKDELGVWQARWGCDCPR